MAVALRRGNNMGYSGNSDQTILFKTPINHIIITTSFAGALISVDRGQTFISVPSGNHSFRVGITKEIRIQSTGDWQFTAEQA